MKEQSQVPLPSGDSGKDGAQGFFDIPLVDKVAGVEDMKKAIDGILDNKQKLTPLKCCGRLVCKGRTPACYGCDICMDCITGAGCGHSESTHTPQSGYNLG